MKRDDYHDRLERLKTSPILAATEWVRSGRWTLEYAEELSRRVAQLIAKSLQQNHPAWPWLAEVLVNKGGRPKNATDRDLLLRCLRDCLECEYEQPRPGKPSIRQIFEANGLPYPESQKARQAARRRARMKLNGLPCEHVGFWKLYEENTPST